MLERNKISPEELHEMLSIPRDPAVRARYRRLNRARLSRASGGQDEETAEAFRAMEASFNKCVWGAVPLPPPRGVLLMWVVRRLREDIDAEPCPPVDQVISCADATRSAVVTCIVAHRWCESLTR